MIKEVWVLAVVGSRNLGRMAFLACVATLIGLFNESPQIVRLLRSLEDHLKGIFSHPYLIDALRIAFCS